MDGNRFLDFSIAGIGANVFGYVDNFVNLKAIEIIKNGSSSSLNFREVVSLAELFCRLHNREAMLRYIRSGGEAVSIAILIARAYTKEEKYCFVDFVVGTSGVYIPIFATLII